MKLLAPFATALLSIACSSTGPDLLLVSMSLDRSVVAMNDSVHVALTIVNTSRKTLLVFLPSAYGLCANAGLEVFDDAGRAARERYICDNLNQVSLEPGEEIASSRWWRPADALIEGQRLTPGVYHLRGAAVTGERTIRTPFREVIVGA